MVNPLLDICRKFFHVFIVGCYIPNWDCYRTHYGIFDETSIAVTIRSLDPSLSTQLIVRLIPAGAFRVLGRFWCFYRTLHLHGFLSRSLFSRLIAIRSLDPTLGLLEAGAQGISIAVIIHSFDRTLQTVLFKQALSSGGGSCE